MWDGSRIDEREAEEVCETGFVVLVLASGPLSIAVLGVGGLAHGEIPRDGSWEEHGGVGGGFEHGFVQFLE